MSSKKHTIMMAYDVQYIAYIDIEADDFEQAGKIAEKMAKEHKLKFGYSGESDYYIANCEEKK